MRKKRIWIISLFPEYFVPLSEYGVLGSALRNERSSEIEFELKTVSLSEFSPKSFKGVDDSPFGGGVGMVMRPDVLRDALTKGIVEAGGYKSLDDLHVVCPMPRGTVWNTEEAKKFGKRFGADEPKDLVFICGRYEGIDERFLNKYVDEFISLGDYILTGGELATMVIIDSAMRFVPGVLGNKLSAVEESFSDGMLEHALYTRPREFEGELVPEAYISGDHKKIETYKSESKQKITQKFRNDLLKKDQD
jgi:tRNA (guanine37-N1)-methyltransferase